MRLTCLTSPMFSSPRGIPKLANKEFGNRVARPSIEANVSTRGSALYNHINYGNIRRTCDGRQVDGSGCVVSTDEIQVLGHLFQNEQVSDEEQLPIKRLVGIRLGSFDRFRR